MTNDDSYRFTPELETGRRRARAFGDEDIDYDGKRVDQFGRGIHPESPERFVDVTPWEVGLQRRTIKKLIDDLKWRADPNGLISIIGHPNSPEPYIPMETSLDKNAAKYLGATRHIMRKLSENRPLSEEELDLLNDMSREVYEQEEFEADITSHYDTAFSYGSFRTREEAEAALKEYNRRTANSHKESVRRRAEEAIAEASRRSIGTAMIEEDETEQPAETKRESRNKTLTEMVSAFEKEVIDFTLVQTHGRKVQAARALGISRKNIWEKLKGHGLEYGEDHDYSKPSFDYQYLCTHKD